MLNIMHVIGVFNDTDPVSVMLYESGADQKLNVKKTIVHVDTWDADEDGKLTARKAVYNIIPDNPGSGPAGEDLAMTGAISQDGELIKGKWNPTAKTFTPDSDGD
jgi:hypothetical protein